MTSGHPSRGRVGNDTANQHDRIARCHPLPESEGNRSLLRIETGGGERREVEKRQLPTGFVSVDEDAVAFHHQGASENDPLGR